MASEKINKKHKSFSDNLLRDPERNARRAYKKVYPNVTDATADVNASKLLKNAKVIAYIESIEKRVEEKTEITQERILREYARIAFLDPRKFFDENGSLKSIHEIDDDTAAALAGVETEFLFEGKGKEKEQIGYLHKIKHVDKKGALDSLARIKGMFNDNVNVKVTIDDIINGNGENVE